MRIALNLKLHVILMLFIYITFAKCNSANFTTDIMMSKRCIKNVAFHFMFIAILVTPYATLYIADGDDFWSGILSIMSFSALILMRIFDKTIKFKITFVDIVFALCLIYMAINTQHPVNLRYYTWALAVIGVWTFFRQNEARRYFNIMLWYFLIFTSLQALVALIQYIGFLPSFHNHFIVTGSFANPAHLGGYLSIGFVVLISNFLYCSNIQKWVFVVFLFMGLILFLALILAGSRAAWMGIFVSLCILYNYKYNTNRKKYISFCLFVFVMVILFTLHLCRPASSNARIQIWCICVNMIKKAPFIGYGTGSFSSTYMLEQSKVISQADEETCRKADNVKIPYNETIKILYEQGFIGLLLTIMFFVSVIRNSWYNFKINKNINFVFPIINVLIFAQFSYPFSILSTSIVFIAMASISQGPSMIISLNKTRIFVKFLLVIGLIISIIDFKLRTYAYNKLEKYLKLENSQLSVSEHSILGLYIRHQPNILIYNAKAQIMVGDDEEAIISILRILKYDINTFWYISLGDLYAKNNPEIAESFYIKAHNMCPGLLEPYFARFQLWENVDNQKALQLAYKILEARPKIDNKKTRAMKEAATEFINKHTITK